MPEFIDVPVDGPITQQFAALASGYPHRGVDFGVVVGTPVYAPAPGVSVPFTNSWTEWAGQTVRSFGEGVCLDHGDGWWSLYAHLSVNLAPVGTMVQVGQRIGLSGNTGVSTGPHLHWQLSDAPSFPVAINQSRDPLVAMISEAERMALFQRLERLEQMVAGGQPRVDAWVQGGNLPVLECLGPQPARVAEIIARWDGIEQQTYGTNNLLLQWRQHLAGQGIYLP